MAWKVAEIKPDQEGNAIAVWFERDDYQESLGFDAFQVRTFRNVDEAREQIPLELSHLNAADKADLVSTAYNDALRSAAMFAYVNSLLGDSVDLDAIIAAEDKATAAARDTAAALGTERSDLIELGF